jgi:hypothetical protein
MQKTALLTCVLLLAAAGCENKLEWKWPGRAKTPAAAPPAAAAAPAPDIAAKTKPEPKVATKISPPPATKTSGPQTVAQLKLQIRVLGKRIDALEAENRTLRQNNGGNRTLRAELEKQTFITNMQAEDLKVLRTAAMERDIYKAQLQRLEKQRADERPKAPTTRPAGS